MQKILTGMPLKTRYSGKYSKQRFSDYAGAYPQEFVCKG